MFRYVFRFVRATRAALCPELPAVTVSTTGSTDANDLVLLERLAQAREDAPLFDTPAFARNLEALYRKMVAG